MNSFFFVDKIKIMIPRRRRAANAGK